ncbi:MAG: hypothetical protein NTX25_23740, partial [Proteobacteria bacterium]|nr:hypothetical protein [Pseudomonadota bacterium]
MSWEKKRFFQINWDSAVISESGSFPFEIDENCWSKKASRLVDYSQEITNTSINFTIAVDYQVNPRCIDYPQYYRSDFTHTMLYKYSFMQEPDSNYKAYIYTGENDPLMKKYGYFNSVISSLNELGRPANTFVMNRWNSTKTHTIYFTESFPEKYKWIYADPEKGVIAQTNKLFERNKIPLRFEIKKSDGSQKLGDIRYSFVHFIEESDFQAPFGYGPMSVHPR